VTDLIQETEKNIVDLKIKSFSDLTKVDRKIVSFSRRIHELRKPLRELLLNNLYHHYRVIRMSVKAKRFITDLFKVYVDKSEQLPFEAQDKIPKDGLKRVVSDYIAGMTDRYALDEYKKLFNPYEKV